MASVTVHPSTLHGKLTPPASKSQTMRALLFASLGKGESRIDHALPSPDTDAMIAAMRDFGANITPYGPDRFRVNGFNGKPLAPEKPIDCGNSGLVLRFALATASLCDGWTTITGDHSIQTRRWISPLLGALQQLGADIECLDKPGYAPLRIRGPIHAGICSLSGEDSQNVSALLIALSLLDGNSEVHITDPGELPYVRMTLRWLAGLNRPVHGNPNTCDHFVIRGKALAWGRFGYAIPSDFSQATYPAAAALVAGEHITLEGLDWQDEQADRAFFTHLRQLGAVIAQPPAAQGATSLTLNGPQALVGGTFDLNAAIDTVPLMAVLGCYAREPTSLTNIGIARRKECDRLAVTADCLRKMGGGIDEDDEQLTITPSRLRGGCALDSHNDHRIVMAMTVAALAAEQPTQISNIDCVAKTYCDFFDDLKTLGANLEIQP